MDSPRSNVRIILQAAGSVVLAGGLGWITRDVILRRTISFWEAVGLLELAGAIIAGLLWFALRQMSAGRRGADISSRGYALLASSVVWAPLVSGLLFFLGNRLLSSASAWLQDALVCVLAGANPVIHFTAFVLILGSSRASRSVFAALNGLMFLFDVLLFGVATNLLQLGFG